VVRVLRRRNHHCHHDVSLAFDQGDVMLDHEECERTAAGDNSPQREPVLPPCPVVRFYGVQKTWKEVFSELEGYGINIRQAGQNNVMQFYCKHLREELRMTEQFLSECSTPKT
jgi:hypothetical protein